MVTKSGCQIWIEIQNFYVKTKGRRLFTKDESREIEGLMEKRYQEVQ